MYETLSLNFKSTVKKYFNIINLKNKKPKIRYLLIGQI